MSTNPRTIGLIGGGNMGEAFIKGLFKRHHVVVLEANRERALFLKKKYRVTIVDTVAAVLKAEIVILAVKPQDMPAAIEDVKQHVVKMKQGPLFLSIAAGLSSKFFEKHLGSKPRIVRAMPNMPGLIGEGISGVSRGRNATTRDMKLVIEVLSSLGQTVEVKEEQLDALTAVSGSGPAYVFLFVEEWIKAAQALGFTPSQAKRLVYQTLIGSVHLLAHSACEARILREKVTSKGGTTAAALDVFAGGRFTDMLKKALKAAADRARQLSL